jgi:hypothetical protein
MKMSITFLLMLLLLPLVEPTSPNFTPASSKVNVDTGGDLWRRGHVPFLVSLPRGREETAATSSVEHQRDDAPDAPRAHERPNIPPPIDTPPHLGVESQTYEFSMVLRDILQASNTRIEALQNEMAETNKRVHALQKEMKSRFDVLQEGGNLKFIALLFYILWVIMSKG